MSLLSALPNDLQEILVKYVHHTEVRYLEHIVERDGKTVDIFTIQHWSGNKLQFYLDLEESDLTFFSSHQNVVHSESITSFAPSEFAFQLCLDEESKFLLYWVSRPVTIFCFWESVRILLMSEPTRNYIKIEKRDLAKSSNFVFFVDDIGAFYHNMSKAILSFVNKKRNFEKLRKQIGNFNRLQPAICTAPKALQPFDLKTMRVQDSAKKHTCP